REGGRLSNRFSRHIRVGSATVILVLIGLFAWTIVRQQSKQAEVNRPVGLADRPSLPPTESQSKESYTDVDLSAAVNQLFSSVSPSLPENSIFLSLPRKSFCGSLPSGTRANCLLSSSKIPTTRTYTLK